MRVKPPPGRGGEVLLDARKCVVHVILMTKHSEWQRGRSRSRSRIFYQNTSYKKVHTLPHGRVPALFRAPLHRKCSRLSAYSIMAQNCPILWMKMGYHASHVLVLSCKIAKFALPPCCSQDLISLHYVSPEDMYWLLLARPHKSPLCEP